MMEQSSEPAIRGKYPAGSGHNAAAKSPVPCAASMSRAQEAVGGDVRRHASSPWLLRVEEMHPSPAHPPPNPNQAGTIINMEIIVDFHGFMSFHILRTLSESSELNAFGYRPS